MDKPSRAGKPSCLSRPPPVSTVGALFALALHLLCGCQRSEPVWQVRASDDSNWLLSVVALSNRLLAVGGQPGSGPGKPGSGIIMTLDDGPKATAQRQASPQPGMLWWAHTLLGDVAERGVVWLCGENGSVVRYEEMATGPPILKTVPTATQATLYGIWAFSDSDVWAVGGSDGSPGVVLHGDRSGLSVDTSVPVVPVLYKLFASDPSQLFAVGSSGTLLRRVGAVWSLDAAPTSDRVLTVWGTSATAVWAVGGLGSALLLGWDGQRWALDSAATGLAPLAGLFVTSQELLAVGQRGLTARRALGSSALQIDPAVTTLDLHGALVRGGARYAVGGNLSLYGLQPPQGVLLQQGEP